MTNKLCSDCKHFMPDSVTWNTPDIQKRYAICARTSQVTKFDGISCATERNPPFFMFTCCGKKARFFEAQEPKP